MTAAGLFVAFVLIAAALYAGVQAVLGFGASRFDEIDRP